MKKSFAEVIKYVVNWFDRHYVWATLIQTLPSLWFVYLTWFGDKTNLKNEDGKITIFAATVSLFCFILLLLIPVGQKVVARFKGNKIKDELDATRYSVDIFEKLLRSSANIVRTKADRYTALLSSSEININSSIKPKEQLQEILKEIEIILSELFGLNRNDISTSIFYAFYKKGKPETKWAFLVSKNISLGTDIDFILSDPNSTLNQIIDKRIPFIFHCDKNEAARNNQYVYDNEEANGECCGSIWIKLVEIHKKHSDSNKESLQAALCISTKRGQLLDKNADDYEHMLSILNDTVIEPYVERIKLELVLFYLQHIDNTQQNKARKKIQKSSR